MKKNILKFIMISQVGDNEQDISTEEISKALQKGGIDVEAVFAQGSPVYFFLERKKIENKLKALEGSIVKG